VQREPMDVEGNAVFPRAPSGRLRFSQSSAPPLYRWRGPRAMPSYKNIGFD
jgi:hypothetical protein